MSIKIKDLSFSYNGVEVLKSINLDMPAGKIIGVLGPNGSGKSTLLKLLSGYLHPGQGTVLLNDENIVKMSNKEKSKLTSFVAQNYNFSFPYSCYEFIMMGRYPFLGYLGFETEEDINIVNETMKLTNTDYLRNRLINTLSGGEAQRILIAQALASCADILLLDEPINHLDIKYQIEVLDLIRKINKENNITIVMAIHDLNLALMYCDEVIMLKDGSVYSQGMPGDVISKESILKVFGVNTGFVESSEGRFIIPLTAGR
ncbi:MAG: ABC transporter ATP-binding protein [Armatimonadota bacterium]